MAQGSNWDLHEVRILNLNRPAIRITIDRSRIREVARRTGTLSQLPTRYYPVLEKVGDYIRTEMIPEVFREEGPGWAPLAPMTMRIRQFQGFNPEHPILVRTGDLFSELTEKSHPNHVEIIHVGKTSYIEITGSSAKFLQNQLGGPRLPARPMLPGSGNLKIDDRHRDAIEQIIRGAIERGR